MGEPTLSGFWGRYERLGSCLVVASFMVAIVLGSLAPDIDILWNGHKGWTHNPLVPLGVSLVMAVLIIMGVAYSRRQSETRVLKWKR